MTPDRPPNGCALVTGAARGIGAAVARELSTDGWPVAVMYRSDEDGARAVAGDIEAAGGQAFAVRADIADSAQVDAAFTAAEERFGPVLALVNNAADTADCATVTLDPAAFRRVVDVNLNGTFAVTQRALMPMVRARFGRIVTISSVAATRPLRGQASYAATKAALEAMTRVLALEVARRGVTVNAVAPGIIDTASLRRHGAAIDPGDVPARRLGAPADVAACVRFLASPAASYVTGVTLTVDGGLSAALLTLTRTPTA